MTNQSNLSKMEYDYWVYLNDHSIKWSESTTEQKFREFLVLYGCDYVIDQIKYLIDGKFLGHITRPIGIAYLNSRLIELWK